MIRKAQLQDCEAMLNLVKELALFERAPQEVTITFDEFVAGGFGTNPVYWALVAEIDEKIVGFALCYTRFSTWKGPRCYLEDIIVTEAYRGQGLGKQLMDAVIQEAHERNLRAVVWQVLDWNTDAIRFYERYQAKFDSEWINVSLELQPLL